MAQNSFTFVNSTGDPTLTHQRDDDKPTIRSHAMREVRRRKRLALGPSTAPNPGRTPPTTTEDRNTWSLTARSWQNRRLHCNRVLSGTFCGTAIDLSSLPPKVPRYLYDFLYGFTPSTFPISHVRYQCGIFQIALRQGSHALVHGLCALGAIFRALTQDLLSSNGSSTVFETTSELETAFRFHKQHAIASLRRRLSEVANLKTANSVAAVSLLLMIETLSGDIAAVKVHKAGLTEMTRCQDGPPPSVAFLLSDVMMSDIKAASSSLSQPSIALSKELKSELDRLQRLQFVPYRPDLASLGSGFLTVEISQHLGPAFARSMCAMRNLINAVEQDFEMGMGISGIYGLHFLILEHQLLAIQSSETTERAADGGLGECCRIGAILYCNLCLWNWPKNATLTINLVSYLRTAILQWAPDPSTHQEQTLLLWLYFMGSFASSRIGDHEWYFGGLRDASERLHITREDDYYCTLSRFFYVDRLMRQHLKDCSVGLMRKP